MTDLIPFVCLLLGLVIGGVCLGLVMRARVQHAYDRAKGDSEAERATLTERVQSRDQALAEMKDLLQQRDSEIHQQRTTIKEQENKLGQYHQALQNERHQSQEKLALLDDAQKKLSDAFKALASEALQSNNQSFLELAKTNLEKFQETAKGDLEKRQQAINELVKPVKESLDKVDAKIQDMEKVRAGAYSGLTEQVKSLIDTQKELRTETASLVNALRTPGVRGRWGEMQLRRVVELAGMQKHCDFFEQESVNTEDGRLRPDLLVRLPSNKNIVVDAKAPLSAYLEALEAPDEDTRKTKLEEHARQVRNHMTALSRKAYFEQFEPTPEFVILFLPGESFFFAAVAHDATLIEFGVDRNVIIATPLTLIALLRAVAYGWRQEQLTENAKEISQLGKELHKRCSDFGDHISNVGKHLLKAVEAHNSAVGCLESRVLVTARKFQELGTTSDGTDIALVSPIDIVPRQIQAPELLSPQQSEDESETVWLHEH